MTLVPLLAFAALALVAVGFATFPLWRAQTPGKPLLAGAIGLFLLGIGGGTYWMVGRPYLAGRAAEGLATHDVRGLIPFLIGRVRQTPADRTAWIYLGRAYMSVGDAGDAAKAYARALALGDGPGLRAAYGEALVAEAGGSVPDAAMAAFQAVLSQAPKDPAARYFLGQGRAERGDKPGALALWNGLLADTPANAPLHRVLVDRIALLTAAGGGAAPDPRAMVAGLAARLKADPRDADGWQRLIRAYRVLGQTDKAKDALATARRTFAGDKAVSAALEAEAKALNLD